MDGKIIEVTVKAIQIGYSNDFDSWIKNFQFCMKEFGVTAKFLHIDCHGLTTNGYDLKNALGASPYPVKTYLLVQNQEVKKTSKFRSLSNN